MIDSLPESVVEMIIDRFLSYEDLINLKLTCKGLKNIVDRKKIKNLFVFLGYPYPRRLFYTNELIGYANSLRIRDPNPQILNELFKFKETFKYLQKLIVYFRRGSSLNDEFTQLSLESLNYLEHLEHLELHDSEFLDGNLSLKNLKIFSLEFCHGTLVLDCEQLKAINIEDGAEPNLTKKTASSLTHLSFGRDFYHNGECVYNFYRLALIETCENLSVLTMIEFGNLNPFLIKISENVLKIPSLKEIRLEKTTKLPDFEVLIQNLKKPFSPLKKIKIFLNGKLLSLDELIKLDDLVKKMKTKFSNNHFNLNAIEMINEYPLYDCLLDNVTFIEIMDNSKLIKQSIRKLKNIRNLTFRNKFKIDDELWNSMLVAWKDKLVDIDFYSSANITQNQFDQIPDYFTNQICLAFGKESKLESYDFLTRFKNLTRIRLFDQEMKKDDLIRLLKECRWLYCIEFYVNGEHITIGINKLNKYFKFFGCDSKEKDPLKFDTLETVIDYCYSSNQ